MSAGHKRESGLTRYKGVLGALLLSNGVSLILFLTRSAESQTDRYWFLVWNLVLAWVPLAFVLWLVQRLRTTGWMSWQNIALTLLWVSFLPNSFYIMSDLVHLHETGEVSLLYDIVMFLSFIFNGMIAGYMSLFIIHRQLVRRLDHKRAYAVIFGILLACSFAIYLGRSLRWNSWDILLSPAGLLFDLSDRVVNPGAHPQAFVTTATFFLLLGSVYTVLWELKRALKSNNR